MNKKFFSALLMGSLLLGGTFVSCSDYDDDIKNLQEQINNLASKSDVEARLSQLQSALTAAQSTATEALAAAKAADNSAEVKALQTKLADIEKAQAAVEAAMEAVKKEVADQLADFNEATKKAIADAQKKTEETVGEVAGAVTDVSFALSENWQWINGSDAGQYSNLEYVTITEKDNTFGKGLANELSFTKGTQVQRPAGTVVIRVSPTNVELTPEMISLVASDGRNLDELVKVTKVERSKKLLTTTRATQSALWEITTELQAYDQKAFEAAQKTKDGNILYAVQVNNTLSTAADRYVTSEFELTLKTGAYKPQTVLNYFVGDSAVAKINNRYTVNSISFKPSPASGNVIKDYTWATSTEKFPTPAVAIAKDKDNVVADAADDRSALPVYPLVQGEKLTIALDQTGATTAAKASALDIKALYVVLDKDNAIESAPSEINAWNSYTYTGLNTVVKGNKAEISVDASTAIQDIIGFRVYAVNWDGTLVDPDGKAFYVKIGKEAVDGAGIVATLVPNNEKDMTVELKKQTIAKVAGAKTAEFVVDENKEKVAFNIDVNGATATGEHAKAVKLDASKFADKQENITIKVSASTDLYNYIDGKTYTGSIKIYDEDKFLLTTIPVSFTKNVPTDTPAGFSVKTAQVVDGVYNCYLVPEKAKEATKGTMAMTQIFNFPAATVADPAKFEISFANTDLDEKGEKFTETQVVLGTGSLEAAKELIDNKTEHATSVSYNYGKISSEAKNEKEEPVDYVVASSVEFKTVYDCIYKPTVYTFAWATREQLGGDYIKKDDKGNYTTEMPSTELVYGTESELTPAKFIYGKTPIDGLYCGLIETALTESTYNALTLKENSAKLITKANKQVNEYFSVTMTGSTVNFKVEPTSSNPTADVPTTLQLTYVDAYGHDVIVEVDVTVKKR